MVGLPVFAGALHDTSSAEVGLEESGWTVTLAGGSGPSFTLVTLMVTAMVSSFEVSSPPVLFFPSLTFTWTLYEVLTS